MYYGLFVCLLIGSWPQMGLAQLSSTVTQLTSATVGYRDTPSSNADGIHIAFQSNADPTRGNPDGPQQNFLFDTTINTLTQIAKAPGGRSEAPSISVAGTRLAFFSDRNLTEDNPSSSHQIFLFDTPTSILTQITSLESFGNRFPAINTNGTHMVFVSAEDLTRDNPDGNDEIFLFTDAASQIIAIRITAKWDQLGGEAVVGNATSDVQDTPGGGAVHQTFSNGVIVYSNDFGAVYITQAIFDKWLSLQSDTTADGTNLFTFVGVPTQDFMSVAGHDEGTFERGRIIDAGGGIHVVYGDIYGRYLDLAGVLGLPLSEEASSTAGGRFQVFERGEIHWKPGLGAFGVRGPILDRWKRLGGPGGRLGFPNADVNSVLATDGRTPIGLSGRFENGAIFSRGATGAWEVMGEILTNYERRFGGPGGWLGFPTSGEGIAGSGDLFNNFQGGVLVNHLAADKFRGVLPFGSFDFFLRRIQGFGDDCAFGVCGGQDVYAFLTVTTRAGNVINRLRLPSSGDGGSSVEVNRAFALGGAVAHSAFRVDVFLDVRDADNGPDDLLGTLSDSYTINNLWGLMKETFHRSGNAGADFTVRSTFPFDRNDFRGQLWWSFHNFTTPELSYDQFATTFVDVDPDEFAWRHPFNKLYYELAYKKIAKQGNCFGMSLESIYAQLDRSLYNEPIHQYFPDTQDGRRLMPVDAAHAALINELNIKQGYQLSATGVGWFLLMFTTGMTHNPNLNFIGASLAHAIGEYPMIAMYDSYLFGNGHMVRPYDFVPFSTSCRHFEPPCSLIRIANPNVPTGTNNTRDDPIEIDPITNAFHYRDYSGNFLTGGRMFFMPFRLFSGPQRTPIGAILQLIQDGFLFTLGTTAKTNQITDGEGHTFFKTSLSGPPTFWDDIRREDDPAHLPNLAPIALTDQVLPSTSPTQMFAGRGVGATHTYEVLLAPGLDDGTPYEATFESAKLSSYFAIPGTPDKPERITAHDIGAPSKAISLSIPADSETKAVTWTIAGPEKQRWAELTELTMVPGQTITISLENAGHILIITNDGPATSAHPRVKVGPGETPVNGGPQIIPSGTSPMPFPVDLDGDGDVDLDDVNILLQDLNEVVTQSACGARCDLNEDGMIDGLDARKLTLMCTRPGCAVQ